MIIQRLSGLPVRCSEGEGLLMLQLRASDIKGWWREWKFHPRRRWRFDFAFPDELLAVEIEGGHWSGGRHTRGTGFEKDCEKYSEGAAMGWRIIRVTTAQVKSGDALAWITKALGGKHANEQSGGSGVGAGRKACKG